MNWFAACLLILDFAAGFGLGSLLTFLWADKVIKEILKR